MPPIFGKKTEKVTAQKTSRSLTELEQICGNDKETYESLYHVIFLDPRKVKFTMKEALENAKKFEGERKMSRARIWYDIAGGLAIYEGNPKRVAEYFGEAQRVSGTKYSIVNNAEKAVAKAQEYYKKYLK